MFRLYSILNIRGSQPFKMSKSILCCPKENNVIHEYSVQKGKFSLLRSVNLIFVSIQQLVVKP